MIHAAWIGFITIGSMISASCNDKSSDNATNTQVEIPKPGTVIDSATEKITEDNLNNYVMTVKLVADSMVAQGVYGIVCNYGPNEAKGKMTMPKGIEQVTPILKRKAQYDYIIGFRLAGDSTFYEYMQISSDKHETKMRYINSYSFQ